MNMITVGDVQGLFVISDTPFSSSQHSPNSIMGVILLVYWCIVFMNGIHAFDL